MQHNIISVKDLRLNLEAYAQKVRRGASFTVVKQSKPIFRISPVDDEESGWNTVVDFTKIKKGGVPAEKVLAALQKLLKSR
jgi:antitoxin (DNA-binding transcriptional repressor) of toxin-antitoxin stability system